MTEPDQETLEQEVQPEPVAVALPGHRLKTKREDLHLSRDEVAHHLHLDVQIVNDLEEDKYDKLPSPAYICGYLRSYARLLKLPEAEIVNAYSKGQEINAALIPENVSILPQKQANPLIFKSVALIFLVILLVAGLMWIADKFEMFSGKKATSVSSTIDIPAEAPVNSVSIQSSNEIQRPVEIQQKIEQFNEQATLGDESQLASSEDAIQETSGPLLITETESAPITETSNVATEDGDLRMVFNEDSWTEVTDADGHRHVYRLVKEGNDIYVNGVAPYVILLGNASGVKVYYKEAEFNHKRYQRDQIAYFRIGLKQE